MMIDVVMLVLGMEQLRLRARILEVDVRDASARLEQLSAQGEQLVQLGDVVC